MPNTYPYSCCLRGALSVFRRAHGGIGPPRDFPPRGFPSARDARLDDTIRITSAPRSRAPHPHAFRREIDPAESVEFLCGPEAKACRRYRPTPRRRSHGGRPSFPYRRSARSGRQISNAFLATHGIRSKNRQAILFFFWSC